MIHIIRDKYPPSHTYIIGRYKKIERWYVATKKVLQDHRDDEGLFSSGNYDFGPHPSGDLWRSALIKSQGNKCCYCEKRIGNGELEHFRPKKGWRQKTGDAVSRPGYYWSAYRWENILLSCGECNDQGTKGNLFPISGQRAESIKDDLQTENALLINPYDEDPSIHISFYKADPIVVNQSAKGLETIEVFKLKDRVDVASDRKEKFMIYGWASKIASSKPEDNVFSAEEISEAKGLIKRVQRKKEPFSGMIRENLKAGWL
jgi:uncharacterized protein (TIGR02646 family)